MENSIKKSIEISASDDVVWNILTFPPQVKLWANAFEAGTETQSDFQEGSFVTWTNKDGQTVMKGKVSVNYPGKMLKIRYFDDVNSSDDLPSGGYEEHYLLTEHEGKTNLTIESGPLSEEQVKKIAPQWDEALKIIKSSAEDAN